MRPNPFASRTAMSFLKREGVALSTVVSRLLQLVPVVICITLLVFGLMHMTPGDPVEAMLAGAGHVTQEDVDRMRRELGLDRPLHRQYFDFLIGIPKGDFGLSIHQRAPVRDLIVERLPATIELTVFAIIISLGLAIPVGVVSAVRRYSAIDKVGTLGTLLGVSLPDFWLGLVLLLLFGVTLGWLPMGQRFPFGIIERPDPWTGLFIMDALATRDWEALIHSLRHLILPALTLGAPMAALTMRVTRSSMLEVIRQDYMLFARAKGLSEWSVVLRHGLRNALIPTVTVATLNVGTLLGGNMIVETIFGWPGLGRLVVESIQMRDYPVVQAAVLLYAVTYVSLNFCADIVYTVLNPKVRL